MRNQRRHSGEGGDLMSEGFEELLTTGGNIRGTEDGHGGIPKIQAGGNQFDLTAYMIHILMKVSEMLFLSVCQIPIPIRSFAKILSESIAQKNPLMSDIEIYRILNDLIIEKWLSVSFS
jgi:hypothetical protein